MFEQCFNTFDSHCFEGGNNLAFLASFFVVPGIMKRCMLKKSSRRSKVIPLPLPLPRHHSLPPSLLSSSPPTFPFSSPLFMNLFRRFVSCDILLLLLPPPTLPYPFLSPLLLTSFFGCFISCDVLPPLLLPPQAILALNYCQSPTMSTNTTKSPTFC